ncbi:carboxypeptidase-like regulatory domain-containing protein [Lacibacterium aquatile]|uniref:Carboxypeptidase-like regulatory domain-containing protein n=1 Tax=Lacibacterium aquatile TaxID=1168082 RepID=A0ABW5DTI1_9PROT
MTSGYRNGLLVVLCASMLALTQTISIAAPLAKGPTSKSAWHQDLLVVVEIDGVEVGDMGVRDVGGKLYIALLDLTEIAGFAVDEGATQERFSGWAFETNNRFEVDLATPSIHIGGKSIALSLEDIQHSPDGPVVPAVVANQLFGLHLRLDTRASLLVAESSQTLPIAERVQRERRRKGLAARGDSFGARALSVIAPPPPYELLSIPSIDIGLDSSLGGNRGGLQQTYSMQFGGDLAYMGMQGSIIGTSQERLQSGSLSLSRVDPSGGVFGVPSLRSARIGDTYTPTMPLISSGRTERGVTLSSAQVGYRSDVDRTTIEGRGPPGYDAELYRGQILEASQKIGGDGLYRFTNVAVLAGRNPLKVILTGPNGQRSETAVPIVIEGGLLRTDEDATTVSFTQAGVTLLDLVRTPVSGHRKSAGEAFGASYSRGVTQDLTVLATAARAPKNEQYRFQEDPFQPGYTPSDPLNPGEPGQPPRNRNLRRLTLEQELGYFVGTGARLSALGAFFQGDVSSNLTGGNATQFSISTGWDDISINGKTSRFRNYTSAISGFGSNTLTDRHELYLSGQLPTFDLLPDTTWSLQGERRIFVDDRIGDYVVGRTAFPIGNMRLSQGLSVRRELSGGEALYDYLGTFDIGTHWQDIDWQINHFYSITDGYKPQEISVSANMTTVFDMRTGVRVSRNLQERNADYLNFYLAQDFQQMTLSLQGQVTRQGENFIGLGINFSFGMPDGSPFLSARSLATQGNIAPNYVLERSDGSRAPLTNIKPTANGFPTGTSTDAQGRSHIQSLEPHIPVALDADPESLPSPFMALKQRQGVATLPRAGVWSKTEVVLVETGEVEGSVFRGDMPVGRADITLTAKDGRIYDGRTNTKGRFFLEQIPLGAYRMTVSTGGKQVFERPVELTEKAPTLYDLTVLVN